MGQPRLFEKIYLGIAAGITPTVLQEISNEDLRVALVKLHARPFHASERAKAVNSLKTVVHNQRVAASERGIAIQHLVKAVRDRNPEVSSAALTAIEGLLNKGIIVPDALSAVAGVLDRSWPTPKTWAKYRDVNEKAARILSLLGRTDHKAAIEAIPHLVRSLSTLNNFLWAPAARALAEINHPEAVRALFTVKAQSRLHPGREEIVMGQLTKLSKNTEAMARIANLANAHYRNDPFMQVSLESLQKMGAIS